MIGIATAASLGGSKASLKVRAREIRVGRSQSIQRQTQYQLLTSERLNPISVRKLLDLGSQFNRL
jgi:hypothetical protein